MPLTQREGSSRWNEMPRVRIAVLAALLLALIAATWLTTIKMVRQEYDAQISTAHRETANLARAFDEHIARTFLTADTVLREMKVRIESNQRPLEQAELADTLRAHAPILTIVGVADADGMIVMNAPAAARFSIADRPHFRAHAERDSGELFIGPPQVGRVSGKWSVNISRRVNQPDGTFAGTVIAGIDIEYFDRFYKEVDLGPDAVINVIGRDGIVRLRRAGEGFSAGQSLRDSPALKRVEQGDTKGNLMLVAPVDGKRRVSSFRALEKLPLVVVVAMSEAAALRDYLTVRRNYYIGATVLSLALLLLGALGALTLRTYRLSAAERLEKSERRYQLALDTSRLALWEWDLPSNHFHASERWQTMLGGPAQAVSMTGSQLRERVHPADAERARTEVIRVLKGQVPRLDIDYRLRTQSGGWLWCHSSGEVLERDAASRALRLLGTQADISARKQDEEALRLSEERFRATFEQANVGMTISSFDGRFLQVNDTYCDITGYGRDELLGMGIAEVDLPQDRDLAAEQRARLLAGKTGVAYREKQIVHKDGSLVWVSLAMSVVRDNEGAPLYFITIVQDVSETKTALAALRESEAQFRLFAENIPLMLWMTDPALRGTVYVSAAGLKMLGITSARNVRKIIRAVHADDRRRIFEARQRAGDGHYDEIFRVTRSDGTLRWVHDRAFPVHDEHGRLIRIVGIAEDITDQRLAEERIAYASLYDALTSLPNRVQFHQRLNEALAHGGHGVVVLLIDADHFKKINDTLGHASGDEMLKQLAERLVRSVRPDDLVARMGGDEFAVLLQKIPDEAHAERVTADIVDAMRAPCEFGGEEVHVGISVGVAMGGYDGTDAETLLRNADAAMYSAKNAGRNTYRFYHADMTRRTVELLRLENSLRRALDREEFSLHYQPKSRLASGQVVGFEALLRWKHPTRGMVSPAEFIPVLEETGLIVPVGEWVIRAVCAQLREWEKHGMGNFPVAINVSARQFSESGFASRVKRILDEEAVDPRMIELEITESVLMTGAEEAISTLQVLKLLGISISVDDFGTGYSSLSYLKRFPLDALKIDRSFVRDIPDDLDDAAITRTIISMAHGLRLKVIAEGVERPEQMRFLSEHGCDFIQGFLLSRPEPAQVWTDKYGRDPALVSQKLYLRVARDTRQAKEK